MRKFRIIDSSGNIHDVSGEYLQTDGGVVTVVNHYKHALAAFYQPISVEEIINEH